MVSQKGSSSTGVSLDSCHGVRHATCIYDDPKAPLGNNLYAIMYCELAKYCFYIHVHLK